MTWPYRPRARPAKRTLHPSWKRSSAYPARLAEQSRAPAHHAFGEVWTARRATAVRRAAALARMASWRACRSRAGPRRARASTADAARATGVDLRCDLHNAPSPGPARAQRGCCATRPSRRPWTTGPGGRALSFEEQRDWGLGRPTRGAGERALAIARDPNLGLKVGTQCRHSRRAHHRRPSTSCDGTWISTACPDRRDVGLPGIAAALTRAHLPDPPSFGPVREAMDVAQEGLRLAERAASPTARPTLLTRGGTPCGAARHLERGIGLTRRCPRSPALAGDLARQRSPARAPGARPGRARGAPAQACRAGSRDRHASG
jgi:hypothetical protein